LRRLTPDQISFICNPKTLVQMRHLSLDARAAAIRDKFNLPTLAQSTVHGYYLSNGVKYIKPQTEYTSKVENLRELLEK
jgi:hypothetical protein